MYIENKRLNKVYQTFSNETIHKSSGAKSVVEIVYKRTDSINTVFFVIHNLIKKIYKNVAYDYIHVHDTNIYLRQTILINK